MVIPSSRCSLEVKGSTMPISVDARPESIAIVDTWLSVAFKEIQRCSHLSDELYDILIAFGRDEGDACGPANLDPTATEYASGVDAVAHLQNRISTELLHEIDAEQASMFGRRFASVSMLLKNKDDCDGVSNVRLLRLALHRRTEQILSTSDPILSKRKALRVRALVDFIWSQSLVLDLRDNAGNHPSLVQLAHALQYNQISPGFHHATIEGVTSDFGPVHINILRIELDKASFRMKCFDTREACTDLTALAGQMGAVAAISGGFFLYSEPDIQLPSRRTDPVGLLVSDGNIVAPPVFGRAAIFQKNGEDGQRSVGIDRVGMSGVRCLFKQRREKTTINSIDLIVGVDDVRCIHRGGAEIVDVEEHECSFSVVGNVVVATKISPLSERVHVPLAGFVLVFPRKLLPHGMEDTTQDGVETSADYQLPAPYHNIENAIAGGPMFFSNECTMDLPSEDFSGSAPPVTFSQDETHDHNLLPRMGVGIATSDPDKKELVCVAVDGRNLDRALGLTLKGTSDLLMSLGCTVAMNLDGGSSKRMVVRDPKLEVHKVVCLSTTEIKANAGGNSGSGTKANTELSRPVHSAILFLPD